jgi:Ca2+-binding EF-hand superfamily protein
MKKLLATVALGAFVASTQAFAQMPQGSGYMQQDMTRAQAQQRADAMFQRFDANHDGVITRDEAQQAAAQFGGRGQRMLDRVFGNATSITLQQFEAQQLARFDAEDLNHDGVVTAAERQQARAQRQAERGRPERGQ